MKNAMTFLLETTIDKKSTNFCELLMPFEKVTSALPGRINITRNMMDDGATQLKNTYAAPGLGPKLSNKELFNLIKIFKKKGKVNQLNY